MTKAALTEDELRRIDGWWRRATTCRSARSTCSTTRCSASCSKRARQAAAAWPLRHLTRARLHLCPPQPSDQEARPERPLRHRPGTRRPGDHRRDLPLGGPRPTRTSPATRRMRKLFRQFSPAGCRATWPPRCRARSTKAAELGYSLLHAYGAAFDNPDLLVACVVGDGEAEIGPLASSWHSNKFLNPARDGAVLPILHLNGYKTNSTVLSRIPRDELRDLLSGYGYDPPSRSTPRRCTSRWHRRCSPLPGGSRRSSARPGRRGARSGRAGRPSCSSPRRAGPARRRWTASGRRDLALAPSAAFGRA